MGMGTIMHKKGRVLLLGATTLALAIATVTSPRVAGAVVLEEGETNTIPAGGIVPSNAHFVSLGVSSSKLPPQSPGCLIENGTSTTVYDGTCTVNNVVENPCIITGGTTTVIAETANCGGQGATTPGEVLSVSTSGPLAGCLIGGAILPWSSDSGAFIIGLTSTIDNPINTITTTGNCPAVNAGGIGVVTSFPP
jgi:hypothetical protein